MTELPETLRTPLERVLSVKRPSGSAEESQFRAWLCKTYGHYLEMVDEAGNLWFRTTQASKTLFAAHTDTVHHSTGLNPYTLIADSLMADAECLGADDGAGVAMLCHMLANNIPGTYVFTTQEECGGVGSKHIAATFKELLSSFDRSICFDRAGTEEIITVQSGNRCASSEFAEALSVQFQDNDLMYVESEAGVYTDNLEWIGYIKENVNLSVGYFCQHGPKERLDLAHLRELAEAVLKIDWESLPTVRVPDEEFDYFNRYVPAADEKDEEFSEALDAWYDGRSGPLRQFLAGELAEMCSIDLEAAPMYLRMHKLRVEDVDEVYHLNVSAAVGQLFEVVLEI